ncbi:MAG: hypothetical protein IT163_21380 [Bryobacterales bacterium]|nr:hypothetical protein [Bryobacterales bacterium]
MKPDREAQGNGPAGGAAAAFSFLWAGALLAHQVFYGVAAATVWDALLTAAALAVMASPGTAWGLPVLCAAHGAAVWQTMPDAPNHWFFSGLVSLGVVLAWAAARGRRDAVASGLPGLARWCLAAVYFFTGFHKLNTSYFTPGLSCGELLYGQLRKAVPVLPEADWAGMAGAGVGAGMELGLAVALAAWPGGRRRVALAGVLFHTALGLMRYRRFSLIAFALLAVAAPEVGDRLTEWARRWIPAWARRAGAAVAWSGAAMVLAAALGMKGPWRWMAAHVGEPGEILGFVPAAVVLAACAGSVAWRGRWGNVQAGPAWSFPKAAWPALALMLLSGAAPYLGLQTLNAFAMYSNLRTEGGRSNHLVVPGGWQPFGYQRELVHVEETNVPSLRAVKERRMVAPLEEVRAAVRRQAAQGRPAVCVVTGRGGRQVVEERPGEADSGWRGKWLRFRPVEESGGRACSL